MHISVTFDETGNYSWHTITDQAYHAVRAAENAHIWGRDAARRYCVNHGVSPRLYRIARQCNV